LPFGLLRIKERTSSFSQRGSELNGLPASGEVFNIGGGRYCNCSMAEATAMTEQLTERPLRRDYNDVVRLGGYKRRAQASTKVTGMVL
jgi:hypothetical protein